MPKAAEAVKTLTINQKKVLNWIKSDEAYGSMLLHSGEIDKKDYDRIVNGEELFKVKIEKDPALADRSAGDVSAALDADPDVAAAMREARSQADDDLDLDGICEALFGDQCLED